MTQAVTTDPRGATPWERWIPIASLLVAMVGIIATTVVSLVSLNHQQESIEYQVTRPAKLQAYSAFMLTVDDTFYVAIETNDPSLAQEHRRLMEAFYAMEPFLSESARNQVSSDLSEFKSFTAGVFGRTLQGAVTSAEVQEFREVFGEYSQGFRNVLTKALFEGA
jgi:hypothetical protein